MGAQISGWKGQIVVAGTSDGRYPELSRLMKAATASCETYPTRRDDACFWLYSSGSTGRPKGAVHVQTSLIQTAELFGQGMLGISGERPYFFGGEIVLRLWAGQRADVSFFGGRDRGAVCRQAKTRDDQHHLAGTAANAFLRRADAVQLITSFAGFASARRARFAAVRLGGRSLAGTGRHSVDETHRRGDH